MSRKKWTLESTSNATFKRLKTLLTSKGIRTEGEALLPGHKLVLEKARSGEGVKAVIYPQNFDLKSSVGSELLMAMSAQKDEWYEIEVSTTIFRELDELGTHFPLLLIEAPELSEIDLIGRAPVGVELICPFGDPQNLGAVARSAKAFGCKHLILTSECANPYLPKTLKAAAGAILDLKISRSKMNLKEAMAAVSSQPLFGLDLEGENLRSWKPPADFYLALGEEGQGLPEVSGLTKISIPTEGVESLNASIASSLALYQIRGMR